MSFETEIKDLRRRAGLQEQAANLDGGFVVNIEKETLRNANYRKVLFTSKKEQLVVMSIKPGDEIGEEVHNGAQFIRIEAGKGKFVFNGKARTVGDGDSAIVPTGTRHNVVNTSDTDDLKLYTVYAPPQHKPGTVHKTKEEAERDEHD